MGSSIDERIVEMKFDNRQFESGAQKSMQTLSKLKDSLKMDGVKDGLDEVSKSVKGIDLSSVAEGVDRIASHFTLMGQIAQQTIQRIASSVVDLGQKLLNDFVTGPITSGFQEYETQMGAIQTIMANTSEAFNDPMGNSAEHLQAVNDKLNELNTYADKTIYNFAEMTRNIGTFTAAGVDLDTATSSIEGIANMAAVSGSTSQQASNAMYQLSQAIATGTVKLMDWNSVVNAGMGGKTFQDALIRTSEHLKTGAKAAIKAKGSFRESLQTGWLTSQVLTETLKQTTLAVSTQEEYNNTVADLVNQGYTEEEANQIASLAKNSQDAATKVKTFSQLLDTLKEAAGSGWTQTWQIILGDFGQAKDLFTRLSDYWSGVINNMSNARNNFLQQWANAGGRDALVDTLFDFGDSMLTIIKPIKEAFDDVFSGLGDATWLVNLTNGLKNFAENARLSEDMMKDLHNIFRGLFSVVDTGVQIFKNLAKFIAPVARILASIGYLALRLLGPIGEKIANFNDMLKSKDFFGNTIGKAADQFSKVADVIVEYIDNLEQHVSDAIWFVHDAFRSLTGIDLHIPSLDELSKLLQKIHDAFQKLTGIDLKIPTWDQLGEAFKKLSTFLKPVSDALGNAKDKIVDFFNGFSAKNVDNFSRFVDKTSKDEAPKAPSFISKLGNAMGAAASKVGSFFASIGEKVKNFKVLDKLQVAWKWLGGVAKKIGGVLKTIFVGLRDYINGFDLKNLAHGFIGGGATAVLLSLTNFFNGLTGVAKSAKKVLNGGGILDKFKDTLGGIKDSVNDLIEGITGPLQEKAKANTLLAIAGSIAILAGSMLMLSAIPGDKLATSIGALASCAGMIVGMSAAFKKVMSGDDGKGFTKMGVAMVLMSAGVLILANAMKSLGSLSWEGVAKGLISIAGLIAGLMVIGKVLASSSSTFVQAKILSKDMTSFIKLAIGMQLFAKAINTMAVSAIAMGFLSWEQIAKGLIGIAVLIASVIAFTKLADLKDVRFDAMAGIVALCDGIKGLTKSVLQLAKLDWMEIAKGVAALAGIFASLTAFVKLTSGAKNMVAIGTGMIVLGAALKIITGSVTSLAKLNLNGLLKGVGSIVVIVAALTAFTKITSGSKNMIAVGLGLLAMSVAIKIIVSQISGIAKLNFKGVLQGVGGIVAIIAALTSFTKITSESKKMISVGLSMIAVAAALKIITSQIAVLAGLSLGGVIQGAASIVALIMALAAFSKIVSGSKGLLLASTSMVILSAALKVITSQVVTLSGIQTDALINGVMAIGALLTALAAFGTVAGKAKGLMTTAIGMVVLSAALKVVADQVVTLSSIQTEALIAGVAAIGALLAELAAFGIVAGKAKGIMSTAAGTLIIAAAIKILSGCVTSLASIDVGGLVKGLVSIAALLAEIAVFNLAVSKTDGNILKTAAGLAVMAVALNMLVPVIKSLGSLSVGSIVKALVTLAGTLAIIGAAGALLQPVIVPLLGLAGALMLLSVAGAIAGAASVVIAAGMTAMAAGLTALGAAIATSGPAIGNGIKDLVVTIASAIPAVLKQLGLGIVAFVQAIGNGAVTIAQAIANVAIAILQGLQRVFPVLKDTIVAGIKSFLQAIAETIPNFVDAGLQLIQGLLQGIADHIGEIATAAVMIVVNFMEAVAQMIPLIVQAGIDLMTSFINGMAEGIRANSEQIMSAINNLISSIIEFALTALQNLAQQIPVIGDSVSEKLGEMKDKVHSTLVDDSAEQSGKEYADKVSSGIGAGKDDISAAATDAASGVPASVSAQGDSAQGAGSGLMDRIASGISSSTALSGVGSTIQSALTSGVDAQSLVSQGASWAQSEASGLSSGTDYFSAAQQTLADSGLNIDLSKFTTVGQNMGNSEADGLSQTQDATKQAADTISAAGVSAVQGKEGDYKTSGENSGNNYASGISSKSDAASGAGNSIAASGASGARSDRPSWEDSGSYIAGGLVSGINSKSRDVANAAAAVAKNALASANAAIGVASPSKEFAKTGKFADLGFARGIIAFGGRVNSATRGVGLDALDMMRKTLANADTIVNSDDFTEPTIRPVVDLSGVSAGVSSMQDMFNADTTVKLGAEVTDANYRAAQAAKKLQNESPSITVKDFANLLELGQNILTEMRKGASINIDGNTTIGWVNRKLGGMM